MDKGLTYPHALSGPGHRRLVEPPRFSPLGCPAYDKLLFASCRDLQPPQFHRLLFPFLPLFLFRSPFLSLSLLLLLPCLSLLAPLYPWHTQHPIHLGERQPTSWPRVRTRKTRAELSWKTAIILL